MKIDDCNNYDFLVASGRLQLIIAANLYQTYDLVISLTHAPL